MDTTTTQSAKPKIGILDQTLGDVLQQNPQAQQMIMKSMNISPEKFQEMLSSAQQNNLMHLKIRDLFSQGIVQQAIEGQKTSSTSQQPSFLDKVKKWFG